MDSIYFDTANASPVETPEDKITNNEKIDKSKSSVTGYLFVSTIDTNKEHFTQQKTEGADNAKLPQVKKEWPSDQDYKIYLLSNQINNSNTTVDGIYTGYAIYGPLVPILQGKIT